MLSNALFTNSPSTPLLNKLTEQVTPAETVDEILDAFISVLGVGLGPARHVTLRHGYICGAVLAGRGSCNVALRTGHVQHPMLLQRERQH